jgi:hypothetical protein
MSKIKKLLYRERVKARLAARASENQYASIISGRAGETAIEGFSSVVAESIQGLMDEGKI